MFVIIWLGTGFISGDDDFQCLLTILNATGRGRWLSLPTVKINNRLSLQLFFIKTETNLTWNDLLLRTGHISSLNWLELLYYNLSVMWTKLKKPKERSNFYDQLIDLDLRFVGKYLQDVGLNRLYLTDLDLMRTIFNQPIVVTNGILIDFRSKEKYPLSWLPQCLKILIKCKLNKFKVNYLHIVFSSKCL